MKALLSTRVGGPETLTLGELPTPVAGAGELRIQVAACAVNYPDVLVIQDLYQYKPPRPFAPGSDVAGVVDSIGAGVEWVRVGDRVLASCRSGGMAEYVVVPEYTAFRIPDSMSFEEAAALLMTYGTSYYALHRRAQLRSGETLLVLGAAGGVGLAAVELGKAAGARVIAAASTQAKTALAKQHGADAVLVYPPGPFAKTDTKALADQFKAACGPGGANVIYDAVGGDYAEAALRAIAWEGRFLVVGFPAGIPKIPLNLALLKSCQIVGVFYGGAIDRDHDAYRAQFNAILQLYARGAIKPFVSERFPMRRAGEAIARLANREATGKLIVTIV